MDPFDWTILPRQQLLNVIEPNTGQAILCSTTIKVIVGSNSSLSNLGRVSFTTEPISFTRRNTGIDSYPLGKVCGNRLDERIRDNDCPRIHRVTGNFSSLDPALGGALGDVQFSSIDTELHAQIIAQMFLSVNFCLQSE
jgi:hypothetical protein